MKTNKINQQVKNNDRDRQRFLAPLDNEEPADHLHQNYRHWSWLPKPK
ncbi:hypothetical protein H6F44_12415 [Pseudanabaena sp. FACHB-1277]|jgi:hypothetical protein|uniref:Uncharacterized protein n=1 Tax=Pseudanabaena cinerea FACHB-1277 TaxID=2949581 RepID=A0A926UU70_9CYAN|nr:hypothetical protein [Pseudanabaena cinerea]MBD2150916.1 hypothetical protein [Pseudanabaena cinerea FACHB-1277]